MRAWLAPQEETDEERGRRIASQWIKPPADGAEGDEVSAVRHAACKGGAWLHAIRVCWRC